MNKFLSLVVLGFLIATVPTAYAGGEVKEVCHDKVGKDGKPVVGKDGKVVQECKKIKVHEKLDGTPVPPKK